MPMVFRAFLMERCMITKIYTDNVSLKYFDIQTQVRAKQLRWHDTLALMNMELIHKLGRYNVMPDTLSNREKSTQ